MSGKLIVIEGLDGCGKTTQAEQLLNRLKAEGKLVKYVTFPDYEDDSSKLVQMYLRGDFGDKPEDVNAYAASSFFAVDRYASFKRYWKDEYENGTYIVANRYTTSNADHQMSKLPREKWDEFSEWLFNYEYELLGLPKPDIVIMLTMPVEVSQMLMSGRYSGNEELKDIHERALDYQAQCRATAGYLSEKFGWSVIECTQNGELMTVDSIADRVWSIISDAGLL